MSPLDEPRPDPVIRAQGLVKRYGTTEVVHGIDLAVYPGEVVGFLGPNGAGKTTTIRMLVGLVHPTAGTAMIAGHDVRHDGVRARAHLGFVPDEPALPARLTPREHLQITAAFYRIQPAEARHRADALLRVFDLAADADRLIGSFSHGMKQKTALAAALLHRPPALFLDEPTVGLDPHGARAMKDVLRALAADGMAILITTHLLDLAEQLCDRIAIMHHGTLIVTGTLDELRGVDRRSLEDIFLQATGQVSPHEALAAFLAGARSP